MRKTVLGVIDATVSYDTMEELAIHRSPSAIPFAGRYRLIDFMLSNMVNSGIQSVAVFPRSPYRSLMDHLGSGKDWDLNRKRDGLFIFPAPAKSGLFARMNEHMDYFTRSEQNYVVLTKGTIVTNMDFTPMLDRLIQQQADIVEVTHEGEPAGTYLLSLPLLIELITNYETSGYRTMEDVVRDAASNSLTVCQYEFEGMLHQINTVDDYYQAGMELLQKDKWSELFNEFQPIYTKVKDEPPTNYVKGSLVTNAMIANGCVIEGEVKHSIVFRAVTIGQGSTVENSIIMQKSSVGKNCVLEHVILDKDVTIEDGAVLRGTPEKPLLIQKGSVESAVASS